MDEELKQAIEAVKEQQPVAVNLEWYQNAIQLEDIKQFIRANVNAVSRSFVAIGYYLKYIRDKQLYIEEGYSGVSEFAKAEFGISPAQASKFISINDRFSKDGNSPVLMDQYKDFSSSKLSEMLYLTDEQLEQVSITTTKAEIRQIGKPAKEEVETVSFSPAKTEPESEKQKPVDFQTRNTIIRAFVDSFTDWKKENIHKEFQRPVGAEKRIDYLKSCMAYGGVQVTLDEQVKKLYLRKTSEDELELSDWYHNYEEFIPGVKILTFTFFELATVIAKMFTEEDYPKPCIPETMNDEPEIVDNELDFVNDVDESILPERECSNCNYNDMDPDEYRRGHLDKTIEFPCNSCDDKLNHWEPKVDGLVFDCFSLEEGWHKEIIVNDPDPVETVTADIVQTVPEKVKAEEPEVVDPEKYTWHDVNDEIYKLKEYVEVFRKNNDIVPGRRKAKMRLDAISLLDKEMHKLPVIEERELVQPELPLLKNNDQRAEWIRNYQSWGEWYQDDKINARYFKYDLPDSSRLVVAQYKNMRVRYHQEDGEWSLGHYHLIQANQFFNPYESSQTEIIEHLKQVIPRK